MESGLNFESLVSWIGGQDIWCKGVGVRVKRFGKLLEGQYVWIRELYYRKVRDVNRVIMVKGFGKGFELYF